MSWALSEWKDGLPSRALQKIEELEQQLDKLKRERQQKQCQMDTLEQVTILQLIKLFMNVYDLQLTYKFTPMSIS